MRQNSLAVALVIACAHVTAGAQTARNTPPPMPFVVDHACPGEGCSLGHWLACRDLTLRRAPRMNSEIVFHVHRGQKLLATAARVIVEQPGIVVFTDTFRVGKSEGPLTTRNSTLMTPRDTAFLVDYIGEGQWHWWRNGQIDEADLPWSDPASDRPKHGAMTLVREPSSRWWVHATVGAKLGWVSIGAGDVAGSAPHYEDDPPRCQA